MSYNNSKELDNIDDENDQANNEKNKQNGSFLTNEDINEEYTKSILIDDMFVHGIYVVVFRFVT